MKKSAQLGPVKKFHSILKQLAGKSKSTDEEEDESSTEAPFNQMIDAFRFAFIIGLVNGEKVEGTIQTTFQGETFHGEYSMKSLLQEFGKPSDLENVVSAINGYASWGLKRIKSEMIAGQFMLEDLL